MIRCASHGEHDKCRAIATTVRYPGDIVERKVHLCQNCAQRWDDRESEPAEKLNTLGGIRVRYPMEPL